MVGQHQSRIDLFRVLCQSDGFPLVQGCPAHIVPGPGFGKALTKFDLPGLQPPGGILQVQVNAKQIGLPAVGEGNVGIIVRQPLGGFVFQRSRFDCPGNQIHTVGIHHGHGVNGGGLYDILGIHSVKLSLILHRFRQLFHKFQDHRGGDPFVGMMGGGIDHLPVSIANDQRPHRPAESGGGQKFAAQERVCFRQLQNGFLAQCGSHGYVSSHDSQKITSGYGMREGVRWCGKSFFVISNKKRFYVIFAKPPFYFGNYLL